MMKEEHMSRAQRQSLRLSSNPAPMVSCLSPRDRKGLTMKREIVTFLKLNNYYLQVCADKFQNLNEIKG